MLKSAPVLSITNEPVILNELPFILTVFFDHSVNCVEVQIELYLNHIAVNRNGFNFPRTIYTCFEYFDLITFANDNIVCENNSWCYIQDCR